MPAGPAAGQPQTEARPSLHGGAGVTRMAKASERQIALGRRTARVCCSIDGRCIAAEVLKNPLNRTPYLVTNDSATPLDGGDFCGAHLGPSEILGVLRTVEGFFSVFKRGMKGVYQHCSGDHLHRYLA